MTSPEMIQAMRDRGHMMRELGDMLGVSYNHLCNVQRGAKDLSDAHVRQLAIWLGLNAEELLSERMQKRGVLTITADGRSPEQLREIIRLVAA